MAMLVLASVALPGRVVAATVDHGLRPAAADEAAMVARVCAQLGVPHAILTPAEPITGSSMQSQARAARYRVLRDWIREKQAAALLTAHHADDQAETLLMRLNRASGVVGLSGIRPIRHVPFPVLRPLLGWRRAELEQVVASSGAPWINDPSNTDPRHDRTRFRALLAQQPLLDPAALARSAANIAEADATLHALSDRFWNERWDPITAQLRASDLPREMRRRLVRRAIDVVRQQHGVLLPVFTESANVESLLDALDAGSGATHGGVMAQAKGEIWRFRPAPPRRSL